MFHSIGGLGETPVTILPDPGIFIWLSQCSCTLPFCRRSTSKLVSKYVFDGSFGFFFSSSNTSHTKSPFAPASTGGFAIFAGIGFIGLLNFWKNATNPARPVGTLGLC